jgi:hypothetical protein
MYDEELHSFVCNSNAGFNERLLWQHQNTILKWKINNNGKITSSEMKK